MRGPPEVRSLQIVQYAEMLVHMCFPGLRLACLGPEAFHHIGHSGEDVITNSARMQLLFGDLHLISLVGFVHTHWATLVHFGLVRCRVLRLDMLTPLHVVFVPS